MTSLLVFGCGYSARHYLNSHGGGFAQVFATTRDPARAAALTARRVTGLVFSGERDPRLAGAITQSEAALISIAPDDDGDPTLRAYRDDLARANSLKRIVYLSTVGVYGDHSGAWIDEAAALRPTNARSQERVEAEAAWRAFEAQTGKAVDILRLAGIYGPGRNALRNLRAGTAKRIVKPAQVFNRIHVEDISRAISACLAHEGVGESWNVSDDEPAPSQDVVTYAAGLMGVMPPPEIPFESADMTPMARSFYGECKRVSNAKLKRRLGVTLAYPTFREALRALWDAGEGR